MQWKRAAIVLAAVSVALSFGASMPATAAGDKAPDSYRMSGLEASARAELPDGGMAVVQVMDGVQTVRTPGTKPSRTAPAGLAAFGLPGPFADPNVMVREVWCITEDAGAVTIAKDLTTAEASFTCDAIFVDVMCTEWEGEECVGAEEFLNESLSDTITVSVSWDGVGPVSRFLNINKSFGPEWWMSHTKGTQRMATASGSIRGLDTTYFEGSFDEASLSSIRDTSIQRTPAEPIPD